MKTIEWDVLKETGWISEGSRRPIPDSHIVSYCKYCGWQRVHHLVDYILSVSAKYECSYCKEQRR